MMMMMMIAFTRLSVTIFNQITLRISPKEYFNKLLLC